MSDELIEKLMDRQSECERHKSRRIGLIEVEQGKHAENIKTLHAQADDFRKGFRAVEKSLKTVETKVDKMWVKQSILWTIGTSIVLLILKNITSYVN